jgi:hypothetical protein
VHCFALGSFYVRRNFDVISMAPQIPSLFVHAVAITIAFKVLSTKSEATSAFFQRSPLLTPILV